MKLKKGDTVMVLAGKDKGKKGKILNVFPREDKVVVERVNMVKKHQRPQRNSPGGIIEKPLALFASKVMLVCPRCSRPTRVVSKTAGKDRLRACGKCGEIMDKVQ